MLQQVVNAILSSSEGDTRPVLLFLAGCNGSGKTSFFELLDEQPGRRFTFVNADLIGSIVSAIPGKDRLAQKIADVMRHHMVDERASFATETVFSDEVGAKLKFLREAEEAGFRVVLVFVTLAIASPRIAWRDGSWPRARIAAVH